MHEFGVMAYLLEAVEQKAREMDAHRILAINLVVGDRSSIVDDSLLFYFEMMAPGTLAEGAALNMRRVASQFYCGRCAENFTFTGEDFRCPRCGTLGQLSDVGSEFLIESIEIERGEI